LTDGSREGVACTQFHGGSDSSVTPSMDQRRRQGSQRDRLRTTILLGTCTAILASPSTARTQSLSDASPRAAFDAKPWLDDLEQVRTAVVTKYADLEWEVFVRHFDIPGAFAVARDRLEKAQNAAEARDALSSLARSFGDRHVGFSWPKAGKDRGASRSVCSRLGYTSTMKAPPLAKLLPGFTALPHSSGSTFPVGLVLQGRHRIGVLKIPLFGPRAFPELCEAASRELRVGGASACGAECS